MRKVALILKPAQIAELKHTAQHAADPDVRLRARALLHLIGDQGYRAAARAVSVNESAVRKWHAAYRAEGIDGLRTRERSGRPSKLTPSDRQRLAEALMQSPQALGLPGDSWTARTLNEYLQAHSDTRVSDWTIWALMRDTDRPSTSTAHPGASNRHGQAGSIEASPGMSQDTDTLFLSVDVYSTEEEIVILAALPGLKAEDIEITFQGGGVTIRGERRPPTGNVHWVTQERPYGPFSRTLRLAALVDVGQAAAEFEHGLLTLRLPKAESGQPRPIHVKSK